jgi:replicative DNA helicase
LSSIILNPECIEAVISIIGEESFYVESHRLIFSAMVHLHEKSTPIDLRTLQDRLESIGAFGRAGGISYLATMDECLPDLTRVEHYARIVAERKSDRDVIDRAEDVTEKLYSEPGSLSSIDDLKVAIDSWEDARAEDGGVERNPVKSLLDNDVVNGMPTGYSGLTRNILGLRPEALVVVAGRPGTGKTSMMLGMAESLAMSGTQSSFFSLEMGSADIGARLLSRYLRIPMENCIRKRFSTGQQSDIPDALDLMSAIRVDDSESLSFAAMRREILSGSKVIFVDYLQLAAERKSEHREGEVAALSQRLKRMARKYKVTIVAGCQLNRSDPRKPPQLQNLRESGSLEQDADVVVGLWRDSLAEDEADRVDCNAVSPSGHYVGEPGQIIVLKCRNGRIGPTPAVWVGQYAAWYDVDNSVNTPF